MIIFVKYDEDEEFGDKIFVPDNPKLSIKESQEEFFKWIFDKSNNHGYWRIIGESKYCEYDSEAFVEWLNENKYINYDSKARVIQKNIKLKNEKHSFINF